MITQLQQLCKKLNIENQIQDKEPYILTKREERDIIENELVNLKKHYAWRLAQTGMSEELILLRLAKKEWNLDKKSLLSVANSRKNHQLWQKEQRKLDDERQKQREGELKEKYTAKYMFQIMKQSSEENGKKFILNEHNKHFITALCYFLSNDPKFEDELGYSFKKGLLVRGIPGVGKTYLVKCVSCNRLNPVKIFSVMDINKQIQEDGFFNLNFNGIVYLDDVGTEEAFVNVYGSKVRFFKNFVEEYYSANKPFNKLILSTNFSFQELEDKYGNRVRGRLREMFNIIDLEGKDMRI